MFFHLALRRNKSMVAAHRGRGTLGSAIVEHIEVFHDGLVTTLHLDPETARIVGLSWRGRLDSGETRDVEERFLAWPDVHGLLVPTLREIRIEGQEPRTVTWDRVERLPAAPETATPR